MAPNLKELMEGIMEASKEILSQDGELHPRSFLCREDAITQAPHSWRDEEEKHKQLFLLGYMARKIQARYVVSALDIMLRMAKPGESIDNMTGPLPSEVPLDDRRECILLVGWDMEDLARGPLSLVVEYRRSGRDRKVIRFLEENPFPMAEGLAGGLAEAFKAGFRSIPEWTPPT